MWARRDWHEYYMTIQDLCRTDTISFKIMMAVTIVIAFASGVAYIDGRMAGYALVGMILVLTVIRSIIFV